MLVVALAQLNSNDNIERNVNQISDLILQASNEKPEVKLIIFPENSLFFRIKSLDQLIPVKLDSDFFKKIQRVVNQTKISVHLTTAILDSDEQVYNASLLMQPNETIQIKYRKIHLFDIELEGQKPIRESDVFSRGLSPVTFDFMGFKFGSSICYDLRFSELYSVYAAHKVDVLLIPSAFLVETGRAHWHVLMRARAIESQCYVLAPAQSGKHFSESSDDSAQTKEKSVYRETYGHTLAVGPWGEVIAEKESGVGLVYVEICTTKILSVRKQIPMSSHRRL